MAVHDGEVVIVIFLADKAARVLAECAYLVFKRLRVADEFRFIQNVVHGFHDLVAHLYAHADVHCARRMGDAVAGAELVKPIRAASAGCHNGLLRVNVVFVLTFRNVHADAGVVLQNEVAARAAEANLHAVIQKILLNRVINLLRLLCAEVTDGAVDKLQAGLDGTLANFFDGFLFAHALHARVRAELQIDGIRVFNKRLYGVFADQLRQVAANLRAEGQLAVRKRARAGKACCNMAVRLAVHAAAGLGLGTFARFNGTAFFQQQNFLLAAAAQKLHRGKNAGRTGADDDDIRVHV